MGLRRVPVSGDPRRSKTTVEPWILDRIPEADDRRPYTMRILHWIDLWWKEVGGPIRSIGDLASEMDRRGHEVLIATADPRDAPESWLAGSPPKMHVFRHGFMGRVSSDSRGRLDALVRRADVVHLHGLWERSTHSVARAAARAGTPYVFSMRGVLDDWAMTQRPVRKRLFLRAIALRSVHGAAAIHCSSHGESRQVARRVGRDTVVIPNLLRIERLLSIDRQEASSPRVLFMGRLHESKGLHILLRAVAMLSSEGTSVDVDIAGPASAAEMKTVGALASSLGIADRVHLLGHLDDDSRIRVVSEAWIMALPTAQENFGNAIFESLAAGLPVVTSRGLDAEDELLASGGAILADRNPTAMRDALRDLIEDAPRRRSMGTAARNWCQRELHPSTVVVRFESLYSQAIDSRAGVRYKHEEKPPCHEGEGGIQKAS